MLRATTSMVQRGDEDGSENFVLRSLLRGAFVDVLSTLEKFVETKAQAE